MHLKSTRIKRKKCFEKCDCNKAILTFYKRGNPTRIEEIRANPFLVVASLEVYQKTHADDGY